VQTLGELHKGDIQSKISTTPMTRKFSDDIVLSLFNTIALFADDARYKNDVITSGNFPS